MDGEKKLMKKLFLYALTFVMLNNMVSAESTLPACEGKDAKKWTNCFGTFRGVLDGAGGKYVGEWKDGKLDGQGTFTFFNGEKYVGGWKSDRQHGRGAYIYPDGRSDKGIWKDGKLVQPGY